MNVDQSRKQGRIAEILDGCGRELPSQFIQRSDGCYPVVLNGKSAISDGRLCDWKCPSGGNN
jgi:hypothetical protein